MVVIGSNLIRVVLVLRVVGGMNVPGSGQSRISLGRRSGVLALEEQTLELGAKSRWLARLFRVPNLKVDPSSVEAVFAAIAPSVIGGTGIGVCLPDGQNFYFWTRERDGMLQSLADAGFPVQREERQAYEIQKMAAIKKQIEADTSRIERQAGNDRPGEPPGFPMP